MSFKILLLGGTGAMGVYLQDILVENGYEVYVTTRKLLESKINIHYIQGNAMDLIFLKNVYSLVRPDAVIDFMIYDTETFRSRYKILQGGTGHYLFLSSYRVFSECNPLTETSPKLLDVSDDKEYLETDEYALRKTRQENMLFSSNIKNWTILRPGITYSKSRFQLGCLEANIVCFRSLIGMPIIMPKEMLKKLTVMTWGKDVAKMIARLVLNKNALCDDFIVSSSECKTWEEIADIYHDCIGTQIINCSIDDYIKVVGSRYQVIYDRMFNRIIDNSKILKITNIKKDEITPVEIGLKHELENFKQFPCYVNKNLKRNIAIDKITHTKISNEHLTKQEQIEYFNICYPRLSKNIFFRIARKIYEKITQ